MEKCHEGLAGTVHYKVFQYLTQYTSTGHSIPVQGWFTKKMEFSINPISAGVSDQRLLPGGVFRTPKLFLANFDLFLDLWNNC